MDDFFDIVRGFFDDEPKAAKAGEADSLAHAQESYKFADDLAASRYSVESAEENLPKALNKLHSQIINCQQFKPGTADEFEIIFNNGEQWRMPYRAGGFGIFEVPGNWGKIASWALNKLKGAAAHAAEQAEAAAARGFSEYATQYRNLAERATEAARTGEADIAAYRDAALGNAGDRIGEITADIGALKDRLANTPQLGSYLQGQIDGHTRFLKELQQYQSVIEAWGA